MKKDQERGQYVDPVRENTQHTVEGLLAENKMLKLRVSTLEDERVSLERQLITAMVKLDRQIVEEENLQRGFAQMESEQRRFLTKFGQVEGENNILASLYVATYGLHGSLERAKVLSAIQEIVANLIGCEELAIFELNADAEELRLIASTGIESGDFQTVPLGVGLIGRVAGSGESYLADGRDRNGTLAKEATLTACVPLKIGERVTGAVALFRLLHQKPGLEPLDLELFDLLVCQAGTALYRAALHERFNSQQTAA